MSTKSILFFSQKFKEKTKKVRIKHFKILFLNLLIRLKLIKESLKGLRIKGIKIMKKNTNKSAILKLIFLQP